MLASGWDAVIIPCADPHLSEYIPERWKCLAWVSHFTGSSGTGVVTRDFAGVWTDSRYFLQAEEQMKHSGFSLVKLKTAHSPEYIDFLCSALPAGSTVAIAGTTISFNLFFKIQDALTLKGIHVVSVDDFWSTIWKERPGIPMHPVFEHDSKYAGRSRVEKIAEIRNELIKNGCESHLITTLDDIAWTLNLRGKDILYNPVFLSYLFIDLKNAVLFIDPGKIPAELKDKLEKEGIVTESYNKIENFLSQVNGAGRFLLDGRRVNRGLHQVLPDKAKIVDAVNPVIYLKAIKNKTEISRLKEAQVKDGVSLVKFFYWLEQTLGKEKITERTIADKLVECRSIHNDFAGPSFSTIVGYKEHGALNHYTPTPESDKQLGREGLLLIDSGGQYYGGTTDITRVVSLGKITKNESADYTAVLKGLIALISTRFPKGTLTSSLDAIARRPLWDAGRNYAHGTGHGVGLFLNVHEGPQAFGPGFNAVPNTPMMEGMVTTIEPGIYHAGEYGIRIENMIVTVFDETVQDIDFLKFESLSYCPIATDLIRMDMLSIREKNWLDSYHHMVYEELSGFLQPDEKRWLGNKTRPTAMF